MGVWGLTKFVRARRCSTRVDLVRLGAEDGITLAIDTSGLVFHLYATSGLDWRHGGQYGEFEHYVANWVDNLLRHNISLVFFLDGLRPAHKHASSIQRLNRTSRLAQSIIDRTRLKGPRRLCEFSSKPASTGDVVLPLFAPDVVREHLMHRDDVRVVQCPHEADPFIAEWCHSNDVYAIVANDSDFIIYDGCGYIPFDSIEEYRGNTQYATLFSSRSLARLLDIPTTSLPLFAALCGNEHTNEYRTSIRTLLEGGGSTSPHLRAAETIREHYKECDEDVLSALERKAQSLMKKKWRLVKKCILDGANYYRNIATHDEREELTNGDIEKFVELFLGGDVSAALATIVVQRLLWGRAILCSSDFGQFGHIRERLYALPRICSRIGERCVVSACPELPVVSECLPTRSGVFDVVEMSQCKDEFCCETREEAFAWVMAGSQRAVAYGDLPWASGIDEWSWDRTNVSLFWILRALVWCRVDLLEWECSALVCYIALKGRGKSRESTSNNIRVSGDVRIRAIDLFAAFQHVFWIASLANEVLSNLHPQLRCASYLDGMMWHDVYYEHHERYSRNQGKTFRAAQQLVQGFPETRFAHKRSRSTRKKSRGGAREQAAATSAGQDRSGDSDSDTSPRSLGNNPFAALMDM